MLTLVRFNFIYMQDETEYPKSAQISDLVVMVISIVFQPYRGCMSALVVKETGESRDNTKNCRKSLKIAIT